MSSQRLKGQVNLLTSIFNLLREHRTLFSSFLGTLTRGSILFWSHFFTKAAATFVTQTPYKSTGSENGTIEVGPGNLKLIYSANEGKLTQYVNTKSSVCYWLTLLFSIFLTAILAMMR